MTTKHPESIRTSYQIDAAILLQGKIGEIKFDTDSFNICANSGALSCVTPDEIDFIPGNYKHWTGVTIHGIAKGLKVAVCGSVSQVFQDDKKENIVIIIERVLHIRLIFSQQVGKQTGNIGDGLQAEKYESHLVYGGFKFTTKYNAHGGLPVYNSVNRISKFESYNMELYQDSEKN